MDKPTDMNVPLNDISADTADGDLSASMDVAETLEDNHQRPLAILHENSFGVSEFSESEEEEEDDDDDDDAMNLSLTGSIQTAVSSTALTVIAMPTHILASKWAVAGILVTSSCLLGWAAFTYTEGKETTDFLDEFEDCAAAVFDQSMTNVINTFLALSSFSESVVSLAIFANSSWPVVTLPHFERTASDFLSISHTKHVALAPLVSNMHREEWEAYTVANQGWIQDGIDFDFMVASTTTPLLRKKKQLSPNETKLDGDVSDVRAEPIREAIWRRDSSTGEAEVDITNGPHLPIWQTYPAPRTSYVVNFNLLSTPEYYVLHDVAKQHRHAVLSGAVENFVFFQSPAIPDQSPESIALQPVFNSFEADAPVVGFLVASVSWNIMFQKVLHHGAKPIICILSNACGQVFSYEIVGDQANYLGEGDLHDENYSHLGLSSDFSFPEDATLLTSICNFTLTVYPTYAMEEASRDKMPVYITAAVMTMFGFTTLIFLMYDLAVQKNQSTLAATAIKTTAILSQLFPQEVHDRLFASPLAANDKAHLAPKFRMRESIKTDEGDRRKSHISLDSDRKASKDAPIADLFPHCTVMFSDIAGFTAWSSVREPSQVFHLLETVYNAFDVIATRRGVFKVETIGDTYLAVTGLPNPRDDHAVVMVRFASDCLVKMTEVTQALELELGPGTGDLTMRCGLHSGPVTAGVLRGQKSRFQLFGDTVNTASRMESTGEKDRIQVSQETANLLVEAGKEKWLIARQKKVLAKGKGELQTWWACPRGHPNGHHHSPLLPSSALMASTRLNVDLAAEDNLAMDGLDEKRKRSVHWISEIMVRLLKQIVARRLAATGSAWHLQQKKKKTQAKSTSASEEFTTEDAMVVDEIQDIIFLPKFDKALARKQGDISKIKLSYAIVEQLHSYIAWVAKEYRDNPFHNLDHAAHVTMSVSKLLSRIVAPESLDPAKESGRTFEARRHDHTYGITSDPLTQFACVFAALIHDADHPGCPNASLVQEQTELAVKYQNRSVAEQNSFNLCWNELVQDKYRDLRACIYSNDDDGLRFRQLVVNSIIATDISDKTLSAQRKLRWNKAFHQSSVSLQDDTAKSLQDDTAKSNDDMAIESLNRKATIVIEHLIQASDVAHTMQHWHIYIKWNEKLFEEMQKAYEAKRLDKPPAESWYKGELGFYDFYIIPLAKKLKDCGVFGVSSDEYLNYANANRQEWETRGEEIVAGYVRKYVKPSPTLTRNSSKQKITQHHCGKPRRQSLFGALANGTSHNN